MPPTAKTHAAGSKKTKAKPTPQLGPDNPPVVKALVHLTPEGSETLHDLAGRNLYICAIIDAHHVEVISRTPLGAYQYDDVPQLLLQYPAVLAAVEIDKEIMSMIDIKQKDPKDLKDPKDVERERQKAEQKAVKSAATAAKTAARDQTAEALRLAASLKQVVSQHEVREISADKELKKQQKIIEALQDKLANAQPAPSTHDAEMAKLRDIIAGLKKDLDQANSCGAKSASNDKRVQDLETKLEQSNAAVKGLTTALIACGTPRGTPLGGTPLGGTPSRRTPSRRTQEAGSEEEERESGSEEEEREAGSKRKWKKLTREQTLAKSARAAELRRERKLLAENAAIPQREEQPERPTHKPAGPSRRKQMLRVGSLLEIFPFGQSKTQSEAVQKRPSAKEQPDEKELWKTVITTLIAQWEREKAEAFSMRGIGARVTREHGTLIPSSRHGLESKSWVAFWAIVKENGDRQEVAFHKIHAFLRFMMSYLADIKQVYIKNIQGLAAWVTVVPELDFTHSGFRAADAFGYRMIAKWTDEQGEEMEFPFESRWIYSFLVTLGDGTEREVLRKGLAARYLQPNQINWTEFERRVVFREADKVKVDFDRLLKPEAVQSAGSKHKQVAESEEEESEQEEEESEQEEEESEPEEEAVSSRKRGKQPKSMHGKRRAPPRCIISTTVAASAEAVQVPSHPPQTTQTALSEGGASLGGKGSMKDMEAVRMNKMAVRIQCQFRRHTAMRTAILEWNLEVEAYHAERQHAHDKRVNMDISLMGQVFGKSHRAPAQGGVAAPRSPAQGGVAAPPPVEDEDVDEDMDFVPDSLGSQ